MANKREKIKLPSGEEAEAEVIEVAQTSEHWNQYLLEDGTVLKLKPVATKFVRLIGHYDQSGSPVYLLQSNNVVTVDVPAELKRK